MTMILCTKIPTTTLQVFEMSRRPVTARKLGLIEHPKPQETNIALNYNDTPAAKMEEARQPRRVARLKKLKN